MPATGYPAQLGPRRKNRQQIACHRLQSFGAFSLLVSLCVGPLGPCLCWLAQILAIFKLRASKVQ